MDNKLKNETLHDALMVNFALIKEIKSKLIDVSLIDPALTGVTPSVITNLIDQVKEANSGLNAILIEVEKIK